ncbi:MAG: PIN domain-containing protein [Actinobacteria bacterium]|nr:PIN domain-containing protein [Actinomycetota bacterium]
MADLRDAPIVRIDHRPLLATAVRLAVAMSGYDALYAALAREIGATLVTADRRLARTAARRFDLAVLDLSTA